MDPAESSMPSRSAPPGIRALITWRNNNFTFSQYRASVLFITFISYAYFHASRKPISIVKSVLTAEELRTCSNTTQHFLSFGSFGSHLRITNNSSNTGWAPFEGRLGKSLLGEVDVAFLASYAVGMFIAGHIGDRTDLRLFLTAGMFCSGILLCLFGMAYWWNIHVFEYFIIVQVLSGMCQATGWPSVVSVVANWFDKGRRGLIMGIWNSHTSVGNIIGSLLATSVLQYGWGWSFIVPGILIISGSIVVYLFLAVKPSDVAGNNFDNSIELTNKDPVFRNRSFDEEEDLNAIPEEKVPFEVINKVVDEIAVIQTRNEPVISQMLVGPHHETAISFVEACFIPGVAPFAFCLFFSKLVAYTFLYWLPFYLRHTQIGGTCLSDEASGRLSTLFDVGGIVGGIIAGYISDNLDASATTAAVFLYLSIPALILYRLYGSISSASNAILMTVLGLFINGPYALITTAVSADLGTHSSLSGNSRALATVTAIIDGTGSIGAAIGPLLTGFLSQKGWNYVFAMLISSALAAALLLSRLIFVEVKEILKSFHSMPFRRLPTTGIPDS